MLRHALHATVLAAIIAALSGCSDLFSSSSSKAPYSPRTSTAYPNPAEPTPLTDLVKEYTNQLSHVAKPGEECPEPKAKPIPMAPVPLMPLEDDQKPYVHPLSPRAPLRAVDISSSAAAVPTPEQPGVAPVGAAPMPAEMPMAAAPTAPVASPKTPAPAPIQPTSRPAVAPPAAPPPPRATLEDVIACSEAQAAEQPDDLDANLRLRMMYLAARQDAKALSPIPGLAEEQNAAVRSILQSMIAIRDNTQPSVAAADASVALIALQNLRERLMTFADLQIPVVRLCKSVTGFGVYTPFESNEFPAGRSQPIIVYCELRNYCVDPDESGLYHTRLNVSLTLYDGQGQPVQTQADKNVEDTSANRRNDFFLTRVVLLPATLKSGSYNLKVTVEDVKANKLSSATVPVVVRAATPVAPATLPAALPTAASRLSPALTTLPAVSIPSLDLPQP